jgi:hypothetical protein
MKLTKSQNDKLNGMVGMLFPLWIIYQLFMKVNVNKFTQTVRLTLELEVAIGGPFHPKHCMYSRHWTKVRFCRYSK